MTYNLLPFSITPSLASYKVFPPELSYKMVFIKYCMNAPKDFNFTISIYVYLCTLSSSWVYSLCICQTEIEG